MRSHWPSVFRQTTVGWEPNLQVQIRAGFPIQPQSHSSPSPFRHPLDSYGWIRYQERSRCHMYVSRTSQLLLAGFFSAKLRKHQVTWLPCEVEALSIAESVKHFSPFIIQSPHPTTVLTDANPVFKRLTNFVEANSRQALVWLLSSRPSAVTKSIFNTWLGRPTYRLTLTAVTLRTAVSPIARSATLSTKWRILSYGTSQFIISSAASLGSRSQPGQPGDKSRARDRCIVVSIDFPWCFFEKFSGSQMRATSYKVELSECYATPLSVIVCGHSGPQGSQD